MPTYTAPQVGNVPSSLIPGQSILLFSAEAATGASQSVACPTITPAGSTTTLFQTLWGSAPGTYTVTIQASNVDTDADYETIFTSTNTQFDNFTSTVPWAYYRAKVTANGGGVLLTVVARR